MGMPDRFIGNEKPKPPLMISEDRLSRIEDKVDRIADALEKLARLEERQVNLNETMGRFGRRLEECEKKLVDIEKKAAKDSVYISMVERVVWAILGGSGVVGWVAYFIHLQNGA
jgi:chromosome segregation ATPase